MQITDQIAQILERCKTQIQANMASHNINASGRTSKSLTVERYAGGVRLISKGEKVAPFETVQYGRQAGKVPKGFYYIIKEWSREKGLTFDRESERSTFAYFLSRKIAREGTQRHRTPDEQVYTPPVTEAVKEIRATIGANVVQIIKGGEK